MRRNVDVDGVARSFKGSVAVYAVRRMVRCSSGAAIEVIMDRRVSDLVQLGRGSAQRRFGDLMRELRLLVALFPDPADSFNADELPLSFIMKRDSRDAHANRSWRRSRL